MKLPITWLKDYVAFEDTVEGLADKLTFSGVEVEGIETIGLKVEGAVVADVLSVEKHPGADRLTVCKVFDGQEERQVVCGAPNVKPGMKGAFASVGVVLADGTKLRKAKIRGVASMGMLCAEDELGLSEDHDGIIELPGDPAAGTPLGEIFGEPETVLDLEITPNRPDLLSIIGLAREVAALYGTELKIPEVTLEESDPPSSTLTRVDVEDIEGCPRYTARMITDVEVKPAPDWMQRRLTLADIRPINNLVDITNYVLLECGHPMHAFDHALLEEGRVVVRRARKGEQITALDESIHELDERTLVIADANRPVAIAGVMGGAGSEIRDDTKVVLLESAYFDPSLIRATSQRLELRSESSYRFERGTDVMNVNWASRRGAALMTELAGGRASTGLVDVYPEPQPERTVTCRWDKVRSVTGVDATNDRIRSAFTSLELEVAREDEQACELRIPSFRGDLQREVDLVEEFARIDGLENIPTPAPVGQIVPDVDDRPTQALYACREHLAGLGLREVVHYTLVPDPLLDLFDPSDAPQRIRLPNPVSQDQAVMRTALIPQMAETLGRNHARQCAQMAAFELGRVFRQGQEAEEEARLCIGLMGSVGRLGLDQVRAVTPGECFGWIKGLWENLATTQKVSDCTLAASDAPFLRPGYAAQILQNGKVIGILGLLRPELANEWRMLEPVAVLEVAMPPLLCNADARRALQPLTPYPSVIRDMALIVDQGIRHEDIVSAIREAAPEELEQISLFDIFEGKSIGSGKKSMAYSLTYRSSTRTLTDEETNAYHNNVKKVLGSALSVEFRES